MTATSAFSSVYAAALQGETCEIVEASGVRRPLPVPAWSRRADRRDRRLLQHCAGPTLDVGCGPGRMAEALVRGGRSVLGIDIVPEAVRQTRARGAAAVLRNVFDTVPAEGHWDSVLLADGNIGIGGDPGRLLGRVAGLLGPGGRLVADLAPPGVGVRTTALRLATAEARSRTFSWAVVGADAIGALLAGHGLVAERVEQLGDDRWFVVARRPVAR